MNIAEPIKQYLIGVVVPIISGVVATWLIVHVHFLALFHIGTDAVAQAVTQLGVFGVSTLVGWLVAHHVLSGHYTPGAKAASGIVAGTAVVADPPK